MALTTALSLICTAFTPVKDDEIARRYIEEFKRGIDSGSIDERVKVTKGLEEADGKKAAMLLLGLLDENEFIMQVVATEVLKKFRSPEAIETILKKGFQGRKPLVRKWSAIALGYMEEPGPDVKDALLRALKKERDLDMRIALIRALGRQGVGAAGPIIMKFINDKDPRLRMEAAYAISRIKPEGTLSALAGILDDPVWQVRVQAMERLKRFRDPRMVPLLLKRLPRENGRLREDILGKIVEMTREDFGLDYNRWESWWAEKGEAFINNFGKKGPRSQYKKPTYAKGYFDISSYSKNYTMIIDLSKSMEWGIVPAESYGYGFDEVPRIDLAKKELVRLIKEMEEDTAFNIVHFKGIAESWKNNPTSATKQNKIEALEFVDKINVHQGDYVEVRIAHLMWATNLYSAIDMVFKWAESSFKKRSYTSAVDTIFLLTDGVPAGLDWITDRDAIEQVVRERNRYLKIRIHAISLTSDMKAPEFLRKLSAPTGGVMKDVLKE